MSCVQNQQIQCSALLKRLERQQHTLKFGSRRHSIRTDHLSQFNFCPS